MIPPRPPEKTQPSPQKRLEDIIARVEKAVADVHAGHAINMEIMDTESKALHKQMQGKPSPEIQPLLRQAIATLEKLTAALQERIEMMKTRQG